MRATLIALTIAASLSLSSVARADFRDDSKPIGPCGFKIPGHEADWDACQKALEKFAKGLITPSTPARPAPAPPPAAKPHGFDI